MVSGRTLLLAALVGLFGQAALAFQETNRGAEDSAKASAPPDAHLGAPPTIGKAQELKLPGFGTIGTLPKLDFGLELLYGNSGSGTNTPADDKADSGAQIRGTLKYRFPN